MNENMNMDNFIRISTTPKKHLMVVITWLDDILSGCFKTSKQVQFTCIIKLKNKIYGKIFLRANNEFDISLFQKGPMIKFIEHIWYLF